MQENQRGICSIQKPNISEDGNKLRCNIYFIIGTRLTTNIYSIIAEMKGSNVDFKSGSSISTYEHGRRGGTVASLQVLGVIFFFV